MAAYSDELIPDYQEAFNLFDSRGKWVTKYWKQNNKPVQFFQCF